MLVLIGGSYGAVHLRLWVLVAPDLDVCWYTFGRGGTAANETRSETTTGIGIALGWAGPPSKPARVGLFCAAEFPCLGDRLILSAEDAYVPEHPQCRIP